ncbi:hypothetical protein C8J57DRAFT_114811 [Mycena rebaudengoi]|nr:hypothetical protein C8J57DRAFT_114811 [Mycena rebaudengoi]
MFSGDQISTSGCGVVSKRPISLGVIFPEPHMHSRVQPLHLLPSHFAFRHELRFVRTFSSSPAFGSSFVLLAGSGSFPTGRRPRTIPASAIHVEILDLHLPPFCQSRATRAQPSPASQPPVLPSLVVIAVQMSLEACIKGRLGFDNRSEP